VDFILQFCMETLAVFSWHIVRTQILLVNVHIAVGLSKPLPVVLSKAIVETLPTPFMTQTTQLLG
jgi:hypothetical protein